MDKTFNDIHTMPDNDKHECSKDCFCEPVKIYTDEITGKSVWMHKSDEELQQ